MSTQTMTRPLITTVTTEYGDMEFTYVNPNQGTYFDESYFLRIEVNRSLTDAEAQRLAGLTGYAYRMTIAGESLGMYERDSNNAIYLAADFTKSQRDDVGQASSEFVELLEGLIQDGSPVRKTNRAGANTKGTRLIEGLGASTPSGMPLRVSIWGDNVGTFA